MIKANQLRVNNWVNLDDGTGISAEYRQIKGITETSVTCLVKGCKRASSLIDNKLIYPINLTEEILLKCGFEKTDEKYLYFEISDIPGIIQLYDGVAQYSIDSNDVCWINSLHQLQNLYFALTEKELEVKL